MEDSLEQQMADLMLLPFVPKDGTGKPDYEIESHASKFFKRKVNVTDWLNSATERGLIELWVSFDLSYPRRRCSMGGVYRWVELATKPGSKHTGKIALLVAMAPREAPTGLYDSYPVPYLAKPVAVSPTPKITGKPEVGGHNGQSALPPGFPQPEVVYNPDSDTYLGETMVLESISFDEWGQESCTYVKKQVKATAESVETKHDEAHGKAVHAKVKEALMTTGLLGS